MRRALGVAALVCSALVVSAALAFSQEKPKTVPLADFLKLFTDIKATSAQKEVGLPKGTWYEGTVTVSDVEYYRQGKETPWAEIKDGNYVGGCYLLLFRTPDTEGALKLRVGDQAVVRGRLAEIVVHLGKYVSNCETRVAVFQDAEILKVHKPTN